MDSYFRKLAGHSGAGKGSRGTAQARPAPAWVPAARAWVIYLGRRRGAGAATRGDIRVFTGSGGQARNWSAWGAWGRVGLAPDVGWRWNWRGWVWWGK